MNTNAALLVFITALFSASAEEAAKPTAETGKTSTKKTPTSFDVLFQVVDSNDDGKISLEEAEKLSLFLGKKAEPDAFKKFDKNGDGFLSKEEFVEYAKANKIPAQVAAEISALVFDIIDRDDDGKISLKEAEEFFALSGYPEEKVKGHFKEADKNGDGFIDKDEFKKAFVIDAYDTSDKPAAEKPTATKA